MTTSSFPGIQFYTRITASKQINYNVWGNILFGYVGRRAGFSSHFLELGATGQLTYGWLVGKQTIGNYIERQMGYDMYNRVGIHYTSLAIDIALWGRFNSLSHYCDVLPFPSKHGSCRRTSLVDRDARQVGWAPGSFDLLGAQPMP